MEPRGRILDRHDAHVPGKRRIQAAKDRRGIVCAGDLGAGDLAEGMNAGIGASGAMHGDGAAFEARERLFKQPLDRFAVGLPLPSDEPRAVVGNREL
jgi:hypothetical protein